jgi:Bacterial Ig-like domain
MDSQANHLRERRQLGAADRIRGHPIRSTILGAIACALATIALVVVASGNNSALAASSLVNGNFETGDLTGWSVDTSASGGEARAVPSYDYSYQVPCIESWGGACFTTATVRSNEGSNFALLTSGYQQGEAKISQPFEASNGDKVSGWAFFQTDNILSNSCTDANVDNAHVVITSASGTTVAKPFQQNISTVPGPIQYSGGNSGWRYWEHTFSGLTGAGQFRIEARVQNNAYTGSLSRMGLDDVKTSTGGPDTTPPETYITSGPPCDTTSATFEFYSNEQGSTFKCQLTRASAQDIALSEVVEAWTDCTSPKSYSNLSPTYYTFTVKATDIAGNVDPTPASRFWYKSSTDPQPPPPPTDTTAPKVTTGTVPTADATGVDRTTNVTATFSEDMDASSIDGTTFKLFKKGSTTKISAAVSYPDPTPRTATLNPFGSTTTRLARGTTYKAVVTTGARDLAGNSLDQDPTLDGLQQKTWFFTTTP